VRRDAAPEPSEPVSDAASEPHPGSLAAAARELADRHAVSTLPAAPLGLWSALRAMPDWLARARTALAEPSPQLSKAAEWLLDNDHLVERAVQQIDHDLPAGFYARLPGLAGGEQAGVPRVYALARRFLEVSQLQVSLASAVTFTNAYQESDRWLSIAELWAFPTMLRLACLELLVFALERLAPDVSAPCTATLEGTTSPLDDTESVARAIANLSVIASIPWKDFLTRTSRVEAILRSDPAGTYAANDFETRDRCRAAIEQLARRAARSEPEVAECAVNLARQAPSTGLKAAYVGHWLIGEGRTAFARAVGAHPTRWESIVDGLARHAGVLYAMAIGAATATAVVLPVGWMIFRGTPLFTVALAAAVAILPASVFGITLVHWIVTLVATPRVLPKLDIERGIPPGCDTAVVVPALVGSVAEAERLLERLEGHYLANPDETLRFALLADLADAPEERMPGDEIAIDALVSGIRRLNTLHAAGRRGPFHVLCRPRRFNPSEGCAMAWERKRGKLEEFDRLVTDGVETGFTVREGDRDALRSIRFVVTVDADTMLPPGSVARLVGTLAHPLNRAEFDEATGRVRSGYTVVQPRIEISPESGTRSRFAEIYSGDTTIDIYTRAVSDVYQDLFGSGIYVGKGIYDVRAFRRSLEGRVPENALASHDLFEGIHGRAALASDIVLYEVFPARYIEFARRWHRWVRGDWQLLPWLRRRVPAPGGTRIPNRLSALDRWKVLDNLRRSLIPAALVTMLAAAWLVLPAPALWTVLGLAALGGSLATDVVMGITRGRRALRGTLRELGDPVERWILEVAFLPHDAVIATDAILRTLWRLGVTRRNLLEWTSAAHMASQLAAQDVRAAWREMWVAWGLTLALALAVIAARPAALGCAMPLLFLWLASPAIAEHVSRSRAQPRETLAGEDLAFLRGLARRTWLYFERFVGPDDHWLPPDNFQEEPSGDVGHRTSPTNIGMTLVSTIAAADLGYIGLPDLAVRLRNTLVTLGRLERYRGHFLNWYETESLDPLEPRYVSTVDSGNLAASLLAVKESCIELARGPALRESLWQGLADVLTLLLHSLERLREGGRPLRERIARLLDDVPGAQRDPFAWQRTIARICDEDCPEIARLLTAAIEPAGAREESLRDVRIWLERTHHHARAMQRDIVTLAPWLGLTQAPPPGCEDVARRLAPLLPPDLSLEDAPDRCARARAMLDATVPQRSSDGAAHDWQAAFRDAIEHGFAHAEALRRSLLDAAAETEAHALAMDFSLLFDPEQRLFHIGYALSADRLDPNHYDLLATEARIASLIAIAKGDVPVEHWFHLGRPVTATPDGLALLSWGGSMFEYLMPPLLLPSVPGTLLGASERAAVDMQRRHGEQLGVPWGVSESGFGSLDPERHYRYRAFGVPGLGLRRGLGRDVVVAPYAAVLALAFRPRAVVANLRVYEGLGLLGPYGFYEAADFTPERVPKGRRFIPVRSYMVHHQGMILAALTNAICGDTLVRRFGTDARVRAVTLLLHERIPKIPPREIVRIEEPMLPTPRHPGAATPHPWVPITPAPFPQVHALGNGRLATWISDAGAGGLRWQDHALTRWLPDATCDDHGLWIYVRDEESGEVWSVGRQPTGVAADEARVVFHAHLVEFHRRDHGVAIRMEVGVAPGDDLEIRRITLVNESDRPRALAITSYGEVVLAPALEDERHPAFSKLFVHSEHVDALDGLLFVRRPRHAGERPPVLLHRVLLDERVRGRVGFESDRRTFLGRHGDPRRPRGVVDGLGDGAGWTLDPVMALQARVRLAPQERRDLAFLAIASGSRDSVFEIAERHATLASLDWALGDAAANAARETQRLQLEPEVLPSLALLASLLLHPHAARAAPPSLRAANTLGQPRLWGFGISGDLPLLVLRVRDPDDRSVLRVLAHGLQLWRRHGIHVDLVVLRVGMSGYVEPFREALYDVLRETGVEELLGARGGIHLLFGDQIGEEQERLLEASARVVLDDAEGSLERQLADVTVVPAELPRFDPGGEPSGPMPEPAAAEPLELENGFGGFTPDGREYVIRLAAGEQTPAPWANVLANDDFGCVVTEAGGGFTWAVNSGEHRLTPWSNDPLLDVPGDVLYLRDEETSEVWTPTPRPAGADAPCEVRHGAGYTEWRRSSYGFEQTLRAFVAPEDPVKIVRLRLRNLRDRPRRVTATYYVEWLLGALRSVASSFVVCEYDATSQVVFARNAWNPDFAERTAFVAGSLPLHGLTLDRREFLGREGDRHAPAALRRWGLSGNTRASADPCAALQVHLDVGPSAAVEVAFVLGDGRDREHAQEIAARWRDLGAIDRGWDDLRATWDRRLGAVQVRTPDRAFDVLMNRWLVYQALASRIMARAGFYQAGGALGFRDQLQDVLALLHAEPARTRRHILACAAHQFEEGDVMHWWHPPSDRGVRTRCADDLLWLPYAVAHYVEATGDVSILDEQVPFLQAPPLSPNEEDRYAQFPSTSERRTLFEHCERAIARGITRGPHGLPLIRSGDWNDGMNRIGARGRGESVWLAWFAVATIRGFVGLCRRRGDADLADRWQRHAEELARTVDRVAWDGEWYLRAFDDDGRPWGSASGDECRIDSIAQSWAVLAGGGSPERARRAIAAAERELVSEDPGLVRLLMPPFDRTPRDPGYIRSYPPGVRENGGQYTHAAVWLAFALAELGDGDRAARLFALMNPIRQAATPIAAARYLVEPYVLAADVASTAPHVGRGGWTWYTGSAAWAWRLGIEGILGLRLRDGRLAIDPRIPRDWGGFEAEIAGPAGRLAIRVEDPDGAGAGVLEVRVEGVSTGGVVEFPTDGSTRHVTVRLGASVGDASTGSG